MKATTQRKKAKCEILDQSGHLPGLITFAERLQRSLGSNLALCGHLADTHANLSLLSVHMSLWFCRAAARLYPVYFTFSYRTSFILRSRLL